MDFVDRLIDLALEEDLGAAGDVTTQALVPEGARGRAEVWVKEPLVLSGTRAFARVFTRLEPAAEVRFSEADGARIASGAVIGTVAAGLRTPPVGERAALHNPPRPSRTPPPPPRPPPPRQTPHPPPPPPPTTTPPP